MNTAKVINMEERGLPQLENGYLRIANELFDAALSFGFTGRQLHVLFAVIRKTYGYNKVADDVSASQLGEVCAMSRTHVTNTLNQLAEMGVITKRAGTYGSVVSVNKRHQEWKKLTSKPATKKASTKSVHPVPNRYTPSTESVQVDSTESVHTKDNLPKDNLQKTTNTLSPQAASGSESAKPAKPKRQRAGMSAEMQARFERFYSAYPRRVDRIAAERAFAKLSPSDDLLETMLEAIERQSAAGVFADRKYTKHPATWLNAGSWLDEVEAEYQVDELQVITAYNEALGDALGAIDTTIYSQSRASHIRDFMRLSDRPEFWNAFFPWVRDNCQLPQGAGFDYLISRDGFTKVKGGQHQVKQ